MVGGNQSTGGESDEGRGERSELGSRAGTHGVQTVPDALALQQELRAAHETLSSLGVRRGTQSLQLSRAMWRADAMRSRTRGEVELEEAVELMVRDERGGEEGGGMGKKRREVEVEVEVEVDGSAVADARKGAGA